jgi:hypothetical protein
MQLNLVVFHKSPSCKEKSYLNAHLLTQARTRTCTCMRTLHQLCIWNTAVESVNLVTSLCVNHFCRNYRMPSDLSVTDTLLT